MTIIGLKELRQHAGEIADRAKAGEEFVVVRRSEPVFRLTPIQPQPDTTKELRDWTKTAVQKYRPALEALNNK
jgi:prevent-host-death family protein